MKLKNNHLLLILLAIAAIIAAVFLLNNKNESVSFPYKELSFTATEITSINIMPSFDSKKAFKIIQKREKWYIESKALNAKVDSNVIETTLAEIEKIRPDHFVTDQPEKWKDYGVDSSGTLVTISDQKGKKTTLIVGNMTFIDDIYVSSYIRLSEKNEVYATECYLEGTLKKDINEWTKKSGNQ